jgi:flagellar motor switch/type III secretory pathway protein FliN
MAAKAARIAAFQYEGLPRIPAIAVARSRAIARGFAATGAQRQITARGLGRMALTVDAVEPTPTRATSPQHPSPESAFMLVRGDGSAACLTVERFFALSLVRAALSAPPPPVLRPLSPSERGVLAAIVAGAIAGAGLAGVRLSLDRPRPVDELERVVLSLTARGATVSGTAVLEVPHSWFPTVAATLSAETAVLLETTLRVELARTELGGAACMAAEVGDAVVFEGVSPAPENDPWPCQIWIGGHRVVAELQANGDLRPLARFVHATDSPVQHMSEKDRSGEGGMNPEGAAVLASAPVEVVAEIGRVSMRGDEVLGLINGVVLSLGERRRDLVTLRVGGRAWARGELVNVDDSLGVRITELIRR